MRQILTNYVDWFRLSKGTGMIPITKESLQKLSERLDNNSINHIVENISLLIKNFSIIRYGKYDLSTILDSLSMYIQMSNSQMVHLIEGNIHRFLISHNLGITWSLILEQMFKVVFIEFIDDSQIRFHCDNDSITITLVLNQ
ncbi:MAG: hypothetical protein EB170_02900 [Nitrosopumilaceae archaeon]|nr:hypothetical protein [Nitrosopumilaceae archaeon]NDB62812.1 hypothetical protein [Nitrosopumilaceae archaeon]